MEQEERKCCAAPSECVAMMNLLDAAVHWSQEAKPEQVCCSIGGLGTIS